MKKIRGKSVLLSALVNMQARIISSWYVKYIIMDYQSTDKIVSY